jgi:hypothetical protein
MNNAQLIDLLALALPYVEDCAENTDYKPAAVQALAARIRCAVESSTWDYYDYWIGEHLASAIINDDYTGLDDEEEEQLNEFLTGFTDGYWTVDSTEEDCRNCAVSELYTKTVLMSYHFKQSDRG